MEQTKFRRFKRITLLFIICFLLCGNYYQFISSKVLSKNDIEIINLDSITLDNDIIKDTVSIKDGIKNELISEVNNYLRLQSPKSHNLIPQYIVEAGLNNNIDICFMMAQTQIETNFGTTGAGRESSRRSMFGVVSRRYNTYEDAINDYCRILKKSYLGRGRTEQHLMVKYTTHGGARYAGNPKYEIELSKTYKYIINKTAIHDLQEMWKASS